MTVPCNIVRLGVVDYMEGLTLQERLADDVKEGRSDGWITFLEHPHTYTFGRAGNAENLHLTPEQLDEIGARVYWVNRGGDVTYHGPGQIVGYPIFDYRDFCHHIRDFVELLEQAIIDLLEEEYGIKAHKESEHFTGVWVDDVKICALGIAVKRWITMHGFAFNVNTNLDHFNWINPCGLSRGVTSIAQLTGQAADMPRMYAQVAHYLARSFGCDMDEVSLSALLDEQELVSLQKADSESR